MLLQISKSVTKTKPLHYAVVGTEAGVKKLEQLAARPLRIPVIGSIARGTQQLNCSMRGSMGRALNTSAVACRVLWNQLPELGED